MNECFQVLFMFAAAVFYMCEFRSFLFAAEVFTFISAFSVENNGYESSSTIPSAL